MWFETQKMLRPPFLIFLKACSHVTKQDTKKFLCNQVKVIPIVSQLVPPDMTLG